MLRRRFYRAEGGETGAPPEDPKKGEVRVADPAPGTSGPVGIPEDVLPEPLRGRRPEEIRATLNAMVSSLQQSNQRTRDLEQRLRDLESGQQPGRVVQGKEEDEKPLEELILEDPEKALDRWAEKRGYVQRMQGIDQKVGETVFRSLRRELDDFEEYEDDVRQLLKDSGAEWNENNIVGAYTLAVGRKTLEERKRSSRAAESVEPPTPSPEEEKKGKRELSSLERDIAKGMNLSEEDYLKYSENDFEIKVPTGREDG